MRIPFLFTLVTILLCSSCSDEIKVNAPFKDTTVIYGLLSKSDQTHFIKINKAFLGEGSANEMAMVSDSSEYSDVTALITKYIGNDIVAQFPLRDTVLTNKEPGDFYGPEQTLYYFNENLDAAAEYEIDIIIPGKEEVATSRTPIIDNFVLTGGQIFGNSAVTVGFVNSGGNYVSQNFTYNSVKAARSHQLIMNVYYTNHYLDGTDEQKSFTWEFSPVSSNTTEGGQSLNQEIDGSVFYQQMAAFIPKKADTPNLSHRKFDYMQFSLIAGGDELNTYIEVNSPSTGVVQDKPQYSNIENGIGVFSTRNTIVSIYEKALSNRSLVELYTGDITFELGFCANQGNNACP